MTKIQPDIGPGGPWFSHPAQPRSEFRAGDGVQLTEAGLDVTGDLFDGNYPGMIRIERIEYRNGIEIARVVDQSGEPHQLNTVWLDLATRVPQATFHGGMAMAAMRTLPEEGDVVRPTRDAERALTPDYAFFAHDPVVTAIDPAGVCTLTNAEGEERHYGQSWLMVDYRASARLAERER